MKYLCRYLALISIIIAVFSLTGCSQSSEHWHATSINGMLPDLHFSLTDQNGHAVSEKNYPGYINTLFFGYTHCPDVCPNTLAKLSAVFHKLPGDERKHFKVLFVSVDPARDIAVIRKQYTAAFGPEFIGLSGTMPQLRELTRRYRVTFSYGKKDTQGNYAVSHSSAMYIFNSAGHARLLAKGTESVKELTEDFRQLLEMQ